MFDSKPINNIPKYLELILADVLFDIMQLLNGIAASLLYGLSVFRNGIQMTLYHTLHTQATQLSRVSLRLGTAASVMLSDRRPETGQYPRMLDLTTHQDWCSRHKEQRTVRL